MPQGEHPVSSGSSRSLPRILLMLVAALLIARVSTGIWEQRHAPEPQTDAPMDAPSGVVAEDRVPWVALADAEAESRRTHKPILYEFGAAWCGPCQMMAREVFADPDAARKIGQAYVPVRVVDRQREDGQNPPEVDALMQAYSITGFPTLVVAQPGRMQVQSISGYRGREGTLAWLSGAATGTRLFGVSPAPDSTEH